MYALVDCNSFFCSVEKVFHPGLDGRPVCVLSSNDGCIVALTPEAKDVGLHRGDPIFKVKDIVDRHHVVVFSSNMYLYAAMSKRVTSILRKSILHVDNYSIDESFCDLDGYDAFHDIEGMMRDIADRIRLWTDIPVSIGVAPTKTLAKMGSKFAKQYKGYRSVCMIDTDEKRRKALALFDLADVWGIGRHTLEKLYYHDIHSPLDFADRSEAWVRSHLTKPGLQTWMELNGQPCIDTAEVKRNKTICTSRSFGNMVGDIDSLKASVAFFAGSCANKLRAQESRARTVTVFIASNRFRNDLPQYGQSASASFLTPTSDTLEITKTAMQLVGDIYRPDILYKKAGVIMSDITANTPMQTELFDPISNRQERAQLMKVIDAINHRFGLKSVKLAVEGGPHEEWKTKSEHRSPNFLTDLNDILTIEI